MLSVDFRENTMPFLEEQSSVRPAENHTSSVLEDMALQTIGLFPDTSLGRPSPFMQRKHPVVRALPKTRNELNHPQQLQIISETFILLTKFDK